ncbi:MAG: type II secretion system F family protein [Alphaproteobacteria bacterium]|nr:type II secretion system F family protein [Alphaproteobacteria bacterium]
MPFYRFWALTEHKQTITGVMIGNSANDIHETLRQFSQHPLKVRRIFHLSLTRFNDIDRFELCHALAEMLKAGVTLIDALNALATDQRDLRRRILCSTFAQKIHFGCGMHAFQQNEFFDGTSFQTLLRAEQTGNLTIIFSTLADHYQARHNYRTELHRIIRYPIFLVIMLCVLIGILSVLVLPNIEALTPPTSRGFAYTSFRWFSSHLEYVASFLVGFLAILLLSKPLLYRIPIISRAYMGQFWHDLSFCLQHDISLIEALGLAEKGLPSFFQKYITRTREKLLDGVSLSESFDGLPARSQTRSSLITLAQKTGDVPGIIHHLSKIENNYINNLIKKLLSWTQPLLILIMGLVVLWILQATIVPLYDSLAEFKD